MASACVLKLVCVYMAQLELLSRTSARMYALHTREIYPAVQICVHLYLAAWTLLCGVFFVSTFTAATFALLLRGLSYFQVAVVPSRWRSEAHYCCSTTTVYLKI